ncbi:MAG: hypothetical protein ACKPKO_50935, partial [Candidatus Fonsibacter sp.]
AKPDKTLEWVNMKMRRRLNDSIPYLTNLLKSNIYIYIQQRQVSRSQRLREYVQIPCDSQALQTDA